MQMRSPLEHQDKRLYRTLLFICAVLTIVLSSLIASQQPVAAATWSPSINQDFPDPSILQVGGTYYAYSTEVSVTNIPLSVSDDGVHWSSQTTDAMPTLPSWAEFGYTWSPSVTKDDAGGYVMFFAARDPEWGKQCIGEAESNSPNGPFTDSSSTPFLCDPSDGGDIDPDVFTDHSTGQTYLLWKTDGNVVGQATSLWSVPLTANFDMDGDPHRLLGDDQPWQGGVIEGPNMVESSGVYYLFYDGNDYFTPSYGIGYATCASPLGPCADSPNNPVLVSAGGMLGPGGPSLFQGPHGLELAFAAWDGTVGYGAGGYRAMYVADVSFERGVPRFDPVETEASNSSYWAFEADGTVHSFAAQSYGSWPSSALAPVVGSATTPQGNGYWTVAVDGEVDAFGGAKFFGDMMGVALNRPIVGMAATPDGGGYWLVASDGGVFSFGNARFYGSTGHIRLYKPIVGMAVDQATGGYWLVAADGGVFSFDAPFFGSTGNLRLSKPVVGVAATPDGGGYWLVASDGGVFSFGDASFFGSTGDLRLSKPVSGMAPTSDGHGYWLVASDGGVFSFGDAGFQGSTGNDPPRTPIVAIAADESPG